MTAPEVTELQASLLAEVAAADNLDALEAVRPNRCWALAMAA